MDLNSKWLQLSLHRTSQRLQCMLGGPLQPLGHLLVLRGHARPTNGIAVPAVVLHRHVDAAVDEESHRFVGVRQEDQIVQDARGSCEFQLVLTFAPCWRRKSATSKWRLMTAQASAVSRTCCAVGGPHRRSSYFSVCGSLQGKCFMRSPAQALRTCRTSASPAQGRPCLPHAADRPAAARCG